MTKAHPPHIDLDNFWPYQAVVLADQISRYTYSVVKSKAGLNLSQWRVLAAVAGKPGRTAAEVTAITPMDKTIVSRAVSSLIDAGLIKKSPTKDDKRRLSLRTTAAGQTIYEKIAEILFNTMVGSLINGSEGQEFTESVKTFSEKMKRLSPPEE
jgi:DNA-binding MarR family transcriptional regulator